MSTQKVEIQMKKFVLLVAVVALLVAACGGGDDDGDSGSGGGGTLSVSEWCDFNDEVEALDLFGESTDFSSLESSISSFLDIVDESAARSPEEIRDDVETMGEAMKELDDVLSEVDYDFLALSESDLAVLDDPRFAEASDNISAFAAENCGTSDSSDSGDDGTTDPGTDDTDLEEPTDDSGSDDSGDAPAGDEPSSDDSFRQIMVDSFVQSGMTEDQATCVVDGIDMDTLMGGDFDPFEFLDLYDDCGVDLAQLQ